MGSMCSKPDQDKARLRKIRPQPPPQALVKNRSPQSTKFQTQQQQPQQFDRNRYPSNDNLDNKDDYQPVPKLTTKKSKSNDPARIAAIPSHLRANGAGHSRKSLLDRIVNIQSPNNNNDYGATNVMCAPSTPTYVVTPTADNSRKVTLLELWDEQRKSNGLESVLDKQFTKVQIPKPVRRSGKSIQANNREASKSMNRVISFSSNESSRSILSKTINSDPATTKPFRPNHSVISPAQDKNQNVRFDTKNSNRQSKFNNNDNRNRSARKSPLYEVDLGKNLGKCYYTDANTVFVETKSTKLRNPSSKIGNNGSMVQSNNDWVLVEVINNRDDKPGSITTVSQIESQKPNQPQSSTSGQPTNSLVTKSNHSVKSQIKLASQLAKSSALADDDDEVSTEIFDHISILSNKNNNNKTTTVLKESNQANNEESDQQVPVSHQDDQCKNDVTNLYQRESITNIVHGIVKRNQETRIRRKSLLDLRAATNRKSVKNRDKSPISPRQMTTTNKNQEQPIGLVAPSGGEKENDDATLYNNNNNNNNYNNNKDNIKGYQSSGLNGQPGGGANGAGAGGATSSNVNSRFSSLFS